VPDIGEAGARAVEFSGCDLDGLASRAVEMDFGEVSLGPMDMLR